MYFKIYPFAKNAQIDGAERVSISFRFRFRFSFLFYIFVAQHVIWFPSLNCFCIGLEECQVQPVYTLPKISSQGYVVSRVWGVEFKSTGKNDL